MPGATERRRVTVSPVLGLITGILIISSLAIFTALSVHYLYIPTTLQRQANQTIDTSTITARQVACGLPRSGHYCIFQRSTYYFLLFATIAITHTGVFKKDHGLWLAKGAAGTALLYSGVAAFHQIIIFGFGLRTQRYSTCQPFPLPGTNETLPVCYGLDDHDRGTACIIVGAGLLAVLPMAVWSAVFEKAEAQPILLLWMLLMASSHVFCAVSKTETTVHYQICPAGRAEELPNNSYVSIELNEIWRTRYSDMASGNGGNGSITTSGVASCLYSCFPPRGYPIRAGRNIAILDIEKSAFDQTPSLVTRRLGVAFWTVYLALSITPLLERLHESKRLREFKFWPPSYFIRQCDWRQDDVKSWENWCQFRRPRPWWFCCVRLLVHVLIYLPRFLSAFWFLIYVVYLEITHRGVPESEPIAAVGQFGGLIVVGLVLIGALVSKYTKSPPESQSINDGNDVVCTNSTRPTINGGHNVDTTNLNQATTNGGHDIDLTSPPQPTTNEALDVDLAHSTQPTTNEGNDVELTVYTQPTTNERDDTTLTNPSQPTTNAALTTAIQPTINPENNVQLPVPATRLSDHIAEEQRTTSE